MSADLTVAILAGGESQRFGTDKALAPLQGRPLLAHLLARVAGLGAETCLIANHPDPYTSFGLPIWPDVLPGRGVLGGLYSALYYAASPWVLCLACDMPLLSRSLVEYQLTLRAGADVVMPQLNGKTEPLHTLWAQVCREPIRAALARGEKRLISVLPAVRVRYMMEPEIEAYDPEHLSFMNINTPGDLEALATRLA